MRDPIILLVHLIATLARLMGPGGLRSVVAESLLVKQQLLILNRSRHRAPNLRVSDRILAGVCALFMSPTRVFRSAIVLRPSTILNFHRTLRTRKYRLLFSPKRRRTGPKGPPQSTGRRHRRDEAAQPQVGLSADRTTDRARLCGRHRQGRGAPSARHALSTGTPLGWSVLADVSWGMRKIACGASTCFRCESATLRSHWVALVHNSKLTCGRPNPKATHRLTLYDSGRPSSVI